MDFDLSQALEGSPESDEIGSNPCCFDMTSVHDEIIRLDEGLDLVVSHNPKTMQCVATLLMAVNRMKKSLARCGKALSDDELCSMIMDSVVDETIVKSNCTWEMKRKFTRVNSVNHCTLCDTSQKDIVHGSGEIKLQAISLKGGNTDRKVNFKLSRYITPNPSREDQTVVLSITHTNLHLSCCMKNDRAVLELEECSEGLDIISDDTDKDKDRFLFYKRTTGMSLVTFESVKCNGWFISTSYEDENQAVEMCEVDTAQRLTCFNLN